MCTRIANELTLYRNLRMFNRLSFQLQIIDSILLFIEKFPDTIT